MWTGRNIIWTDVPEITAENIITVLRDAVTDFAPIAQRCKFLLEYEAGNQPVIRDNPKTYRPDIDVQAVDNVANEITEFKTSFNWCPITLVQRGEKDSGKANEADAISLLNECYAAEENAKKTRELARYVEICGIGHTFIDINTEYEEGDSFFHVNVLNPCTSFVVRSSLYPDHRVMLGVTFRTDKKRNRYFTCFTKTMRFEVENLNRIINGQETTKQTWRQSSRSGEENPLGRIPITEWIRDYDRMGGFERQISALDNLNLILSDMSNDIEQNTSAFFHANDLDFPVDEDGNEVRPKNGDWLETFTTPDGKTPFINPLTVDYDYNGMLEHYMAQRSLILQKCNIPNRDSDMSNSTGLAASFAGGYAGAESQANKQSDIMYGCKMDEIKSVLAAIRKSPFVPVNSPLLELKYTDIQPKITRQRSYEMTVKSNCLSTLLNTGVHPMHALRVCNLFEDVAQTFSDSKDMMIKIQNSLVQSSSSNSEEKMNKSSDRVTDQIENSPLIDGGGTDIKK